MQQEIDSTPDLCTFTPVDVVVLRYRRNRPADLVIPGRVAEDAASHIALFTMSGTVLEGQATASGKRLTRAMPFLERERIVNGMADFTWRRNHMLQLILPGEARATWLLWSDHHWSLQAWYVNLQAPIQRTEWASTWLIICLIDITPNLQWSWKERDVVDETRRHGLVAPEIHDRMEREGERAIRDIEAWAWTSDADNEHWRLIPHGGSRHFWMGEMPGWTDRLYSSCKGIMSPEG
ncbi:MAG TPA: hypothetical protein VGR29_11405 [Thermomicrobiales bacterium]|nr:hypothetical protein [Thermomicrobiales bacterium]